MQFDEVLRSFAEFFGQNRIRYAVIGGLAMQVWGRSRFTRDIDFVVPRSEQPRVIAFAESIGFETLHAGVGYSNHLRAGTDRVDFMYVDEQTATSIFAGASIRRIVGDVDAPVARPEHLAMMKAISMKDAPQRIVFEGEDVRTLLAVPGVDRKAIRDYFDKHGLLELFDAIERAR